MVLMACSIASRSVVSSHGLTSRTTIVFATSMQTQKRKTVIDNNCHGFEPFADGYENEKEIN